MKSSFQRPLRSCSREDLRAIRGSVEVVKAAMETAAEALKVLSSLETKMLMLSPGLEREMNYYDLVRKFECDVITRALHQTNGSQVQAARLLGLKTTTLNNKVKAYRFQKEFGFVAEAGKAARSKRLKESNDNLVA